MKAHATGSFDIDGWSDETYDEQGGVKLGRARLSKTFHGDVTGTSMVEILTAQAPKGAAAYVGLERLTGRVHGHSGSFVLVHCATDSQAEAVSLEVLAGSATDELAGLRGMAQIVRHPDGRHDFTLDYELP